ncbi:hypothetical protein F4818DRAFT_444958 [Hypoxylon cercidicola]|nr:hypothetical protein F4818DRAFT_444958 [Hypoxylon cercidicola]
MSALKKKQSVVFMQPTVTSAAQSPAKSEKGGGARLDAVLDIDDLRDGFEQLSVAGTPMQTSPGLVRGGNGSRSPFGQELRGTTDDVFSSSPAGTPGQSASVAMASDSRYLSPSMHGVVANMEPVKILRSRASHMGIRTHVGNVDAQSYYPATACVFVANLPEYVRDSKLEAKLTQIFSAYGMVFVKIRRDQRNMPFAFCQFTKDEHALEAVTKGKGSLVDGRPCRCEMVKANRTFVLYSVVYDVVGTDEARALLASFGPVAKCEALQPEAQEAMGAKGGVLVEFTKFDPNRDVVAAFRNDQQYRVKPYDLKKGGDKKRMDPDEAWLQRYEVDRRSIFVGNLPTEIANLEEHVTAITKSAGVEVEKVHIVRKDGTRGRIQPSAFGFVEFKTPDMADAAVQRLTGYTFHGCQLRVERKTSKEPRIVQRVRSVPVFPEDSEKETTSDLERPIRPVRSQVFRSLDSETETEHATAADQPMTPSHFVGTNPPTSAPHAYPYAPYMPYGPHALMGGMPFPGQAGSFITPQGTPGMVSSQFYGTPIWVTPYLQDPSFGMGQPPYPSSQYSSAFATGMGPGAMTGAAPVDEDNNSTTPTKANPGKLRGTKRLDDA